jgi:hypothetical protein
MALQIGDMQSIGVGGWWTTVPTSSTPGEPTLSVVSDNDGNSVTATVDGDAGVTNQLYYRTLEDTAWTTGSSRSGDGDIAQAGLTDHTAYDFVCVSSSGGYNSVPSEVVRVYVSSGTQHIYQIEAIVNVDMRAAEMEILCMEAPD